jgi:hypothetical protein
MRDTSMPTFHVTIRDTFNKNLVDEPFVATDAREALVKGMTIVMSEKPAAADFAEVYLQDEPLIRDLYTFTTDGHTHPQDKHRGRWKVYVDPGV